MRRATGGLIAALAVLAALCGVPGCGTANIVFERLRQPHGRYGTRETQVASAARLDAGTGELRLVANGDNYYDYHYWYEAYDFYPPLYGRWSRPPAWSAPYYYEVFLSIRVKDFPPRGQRRDLRPDEVSLAFGKLDEGTVFTRLILEVTEATGYWQDDRPVVEFRTGGAPKEDGHLERGEGQYADVHSPAVALLLASTEVHATLEATLSQQVYESVMNRFLELGIAELMSPPENETIPPTNPAPEQ